MRPTCSAQTLRLDRTKRRTCWPAELAGFSTGARTQLQTVLGLRSAHRICSLSDGALASAIRDAGRTHPGVPRSERGRGEG